MNWGFLDSDARTRALWLAGGAFRSVGIEPGPPPDNPYDCPWLLYGEVGTHKLLAYVHLTTGEDSGEGTGPVPPVLIDTARFLGAEPFVLRIHTREVGQGIGVAYFGRDELIHHVKNLGPVWDDTLLHPHRFEDFVRWTRGRISTLRIDLVERAEWGQWATELELTIDGQEPYGGTICPFHLMNSTHRSDVHWIFTCSCGEPGCARVDRGVVVVHRGPLTLWKAYHARRRRIFLFDRAQYRGEILRAGRILVQEFRREQYECVPWVNRMKLVEKAYFEATR